MSSSLRVDTSRRISPLIPQFRVLPAYRFTQLLVGGGGPTDSVNVEAEDGQPINNPSPETAETDNRDPFTCNLPRSVPLGLGPVCLPLVGEVFVKTTSERKQVPSYGFADRVAVNTGGVRENYDIEVSYRRGTTYLRRLPLSSGLWRPGIAQDYCFSRHNW